MAMMTISVPFEDIEFHPEIKNAREGLGDIDGLVQSIKEVGLRTPVWVLHQETKRRPEGVSEEEFRRHRYFLTAGFRRYEAITRIRRENPEAFREIEASRFKGSIAEAQVLNITENIQREDLKPLEIANAVALLMNLGFKQNEIARKIGKSPTWVSNAIEFRRSATPQLRDAVRDSKISYVLARQIATLDDNDQRSKVSALLDELASPQEEKAPDPAKKNGSGNGASTKPGRFADAEIRTSIRESSTRIIRPTTTEIRKAVARFQGKGEEEALNDFEAGVLIALQWCLGEKKTLLRPQE